jgi:hypothetical protein
VRIGSTTRLDAGLANALRTHGSVVCRGVRHVAIDVLPRQVITFRTVCGQDVVEDEKGCTDVTVCSWCLRVERTWVLAKATEVI